MGASIKTGNNENEYFNQRHPLACGQQPGKTLKAQHTIYGLDIVSPQKEGVVSTFGWNELEQVPPVDAVIHLAGKANDTKNQTNAQVYFDINVGLTQQQ